MPDDLTTRLAVALAIELDINYIKSDAPRIKEPLLLLHEFAEVYDRVPPVVRHILRWLH